MGIVSGTYKIVYFVLAILIALALISQDSQAMSSDCDPSKFAKLESSKGMGQVALADRSEFFARLTSSSNESPQQVQLFLKRKDSNPHKYNQMENSIFRGSGLKLIGTEPPKAETVGYVVLNVEVSSKDAAEHLISMEDKFKGIFQLKDRPNNLASNVAKIDSPKATLNLTEIHSPESAMDALDGFLSENFGHLSSDHALMKRHLLERYLSNPEFLKDPKTVAIKALNERGGLHYFAVDSDPILALFESLIKSDSLEKFAKNIRASDVSASLKSARATASDVVPTTVKQEPLASKPIFVAPAKPIMPKTNSELDEYVKNLAQTRRQDLDSISQALSGVTMEKPATIDVILRRQDVEMGLSNQVENSLMGASGVKYVGMNLDKDFQRGTVVVTLTVNSKQGADRLISVLNEYPEVALTARKHDLPKPVVASVSPSAVPLNFSKIESPEDASRLIDGFLEQEFGHLSGDHPAMKKFLKEKFFSDQKFHQNPRQVVTEAIKARGGLQYFAVESDPILDFMKKLLEANSLESFVKHYKSL